MSRGSGFWDDKECAHERREVKPCEDCEYPHAWCSDCGLPEHQEDQLVRKEIEEGSYVEQEDEPEELTPIIEISDDDEPEQDKPLKRERPASPVYRVEPKKTEQKWMKYGENPDLFHYFEHFDTSPIQDIGICRTYANHLASLVPKTRPTTYKKQKK